jgi:IPT/TIG domain
VADPDPDVCIRISVVNSAGQPLGGTVNIDFQPQTSGPELNARGADASKNIDVPGLQRAPNGLYQVTVTPTDVFKPSSQFVNIPASGFATATFVIDKGTTGGTPDICIRVRVLNTQNQPLGGTVDLVFQPQAAGQVVNVLSQDSSKDIDVTGLQRDPNGLYQLTVTPTDVPTSSTQSVSVPAVGFNTVQFIIDKGSGDGICVRLRVLNLQRQPLGGTVDIELKPQVAGPTVTLHGDASKDIDVAGLQRSPQGLYEVTVTPADVFIPASQFITVPASGFITVEFLIDKTATQQPPTNNHEDPSMGEIMRFRLARSAQRRIPSTQSVVNLGTTAAYQVAPDTLQKIQSLRQNPADANPNVTAYSQGLADASTLQTAAAAALPVLPGLLELDAWLVSRNNSPALADLKSAITSFLGANVTESAPWQTLRKTLAEQLYAALILNALGKSISTDVLALLVRLMLVVALVDAVEANPSPIQTANDVYAALRWRTLVLPDAVTSELTAIRQSNAVLVRKPGFADLYITREEWDHYEPAEIASIENILGGESKSRVHVLVNQTQTSTTTDTSTTSTKEQDTTTTDRTQLQQQASSDITIAAHVDGKVDTSGQYGPTQVNTHIGGSLDYSNASTTSKATTQSHETVARAVSRIEQTTREVRTTSTLTRATDREKHDFDNSKQTSPVVGVYRWVDQIQNVELDRYPHRFLMEFEIPEPGAWTRWAHQNDLTRNMINPVPAPLTVTGNPGDPPLTPGALGSATLPGFVARYRVTGISPEPSPQIVIAVNLGYPASGSTAKNESVTVFQEDSSLTVPNGYQAQNWNASTIVQGPQGQNIYVAVGGGTPKAQTGIGILNGEVGPINQGTIPVSIVGIGAIGFEVNIEVVCGPTQSTIAQWRSDSYDLIVAAYNRMLQAYNDERAGLDVQQTSLADAASPAQNSQTVTQELKRQVIEMLIGSPFKGRNAITWDPSGLNAPATQLAAAAAYAPLIQFLEQAFEWETLSYICYPYYWADSTRWKDLAVISGNDSDFADFLRAGSARVVVAARPGFEDQVNFFTAVGILWGGGPMPAPGDPTYLSIADEIKDQQQRPMDVTVIDTWQVRLPTTLVWLEQNPAGLPSNPNPTITMRPHIGTVSPVSGPVGAAVTITGMDFGIKQGDSSVTFNGVQATPVSWGATSIQTAVPAGAATGNLAVTVNGLQSNSVNFVVG